MGQLSHLEFESQRLFFPSSTFLKPANVTCARKPSYVSLRYFTLFCFSLCYFLVNPWYQVGILWSNSKWKWPAMKRGASPAQVTNQLQPYPNPYPYPKPNPKLNPTLGEEAATDVQDGPTRGLRKWDDERVIIHKDIRVNISRSKYGISD